MPKDLDNLLYHSHLQADIVALPWHAAHYSVKDQKALSPVPGFLNFIISLFKIRHSSSAGNGCRIC